MFRRLPKEDKLAEKLDLSYGSQVSATSPLASSSWSVLKVSAKSLLTSPQWLRQQVWTVSTEIVLSLLAAIGLVRGIEAGKVALGLAVVYALAAFAALPLARGGKGRLAWVGFFTVALAIAATTQHGKAGWWWLAGAAGGLMAFRDSAYLSATAWSPWRAMRCRTSPLSMAATSQSLGILIAAIATLLSAIAQKYWPGWAAAVVLFALIVGIPDAFMQRKHLPSVRQPIKAFKQSWKIPDLHHPRVRPVMTTAILFSAAHLMGRRMVLPLLLIAFTSRLGWESHALVMVGVAMSFISVVALLGRLASSPSKNMTPQEWFKKGIKVNTIAWIVIIVLAFVQSYVHIAIAFVWLLVAWLAMEIAGRRWSVGYIDTLRALSHEVRVRRNRAHREVLTADILARNSVAAGGLVLGAFAASVMPAVMLSILSVCAWRVWRQTK